MEHFLNFMKHWPLYAVDTVVKVSGDAFAQQWDRMAIAIA